MRKQLAAAGLTAGLAVGGIAGFAFTSGSAAVGAQDGTTTTTAPAAPRGDRPERSAHIQETLEPLVDDGTITQAQADKVAEALIAAKPDGGRGGGPHGGGRGGFGIGLDAAAEALGITADELKTELQDGSSIADVAVEQGVDLSKVIDALVAEATLRLDEQVTSGKITQAQADERAAQLKERIATMVNGEFPAGRPGGGRGGFGHGPEGGAPGAREGAAPAEAPTTTEG